MSGKTEIAIATPRADRIPGGQELVRNGSWWRPSATAAVQAQRFSAQAMPPDHGLVLLVSAVHLIDGQIHSVTLHPHPGWQERKPVRVLAEEFLRDFSEEREGEVLREREIDRAMGRTQSIVAAMSRVPPEDELLALSPPAEPSSAPPAGPGKGSGCAGSRRRPQGGTGAYREGHGNCQCPSGLDRGTIPRHACRHGCRGRLSVREGRGDHRGYA